MPEVVVLGSSLAGLWAAAAAAGAGARTVVVDRDLAPVGDSVRPGVPQGTQPHVFLHRGLRAAEQLLPGLRADLIAAGAVRIDTGLLPWLGEHGWAPSAPSYEVVSLTRPLLERVVRERVLALPRVEVRWGTRVEGLSREDAGWRIRVRNGPDIIAPFVVDATGRNSRLPTWLTGIGVRVPPPVVVDARLGYATRVIEGGPDPHDLPGVVVQPIPASPVGGAALPVEGGCWLVNAAGFGDHRPPRDADGFAAFLAALQDPALSAILASGRPVGEVAVYRQTANRRQRYSRVRDWPSGLLAVGDALCCFDPLYGQGITVSALEALHMRAALVAGPRPDTARRLLRAFDRVIDFPWAIAIGQDLQMPSSSGRQSRLQAAVSAWASQVARRAVCGDRRARDVLLSAYHLESSPAALLHPALVASVAVGALRHTAAAASRPATLDALTARPRSAGTRHPAGVPGRSVRTVTDEGGKV